MKSLAIEREYGSGGREIGTKVAKLCNIPYYDEELLLESAKEQGVSVDMLRYYDEKRTGSFLYDLANFSNYTLTSRHNVYYLFSGMARTIENLAKKGPSIFIGRCSTEILKDNPKVLRVFIYSSDMEKRVQRIMRIENTTSDNARKLIDKNDKERQNYFKSFTNKDWKDRNNYEMELNSATLSSDECAEILSRIIQQ